MVSLSESGKLDPAGLLQPSEPAGSALQALLDSVTHALDRHDVALALRLADRARRVAPGNTTCRLLYARLLTKAGFAGEALHHLIDEKDPSVVLARGVAFLEQGLSAKAIQCCEYLLQTFSLDAVDGLASLASRICQAEGNGIPQGWVGVDNNLKLVGEARSRRPIAVKNADGIDHPVMLRKHQGAPDSFVCTLPATTPGQLSIRTNDCDLLGSGLSWPPDFQPSAWVALEDNNLVGEAQIDWSPRLPLQLEVTYPGELPLRTIWTHPGHASDRCSFSLHLSPAEYEASSIEVAAVLPNGNRVPLIGSPLTPHRRLGAIGGQQAELETSPAEAAIVDIIVPVYMGKEETLGCLESLFRTTNRETAEIVVVNDASPDQPLVEALARLAVENKITLLNNARNLGFAGAVNRGLALHQHRDVVLLNADTEVFGDWLQRLASAARTSADIGTATPMGENGSVTDYAGDATRPGALAEEIDRIASRANARKVIDLPVGVGFCMFIKRQCLQQTGHLDAATFVKGYGEENDFCLRAFSLGWRHVAATDVFVKHYGGRSFGEGTKLLKKRNSRMLNTLHPGYTALIEKFADADPLLEARRAIDMARLRNNAPDPVLLITHDLQGGVKRHVQERRIGLDAAGYTVLTLQPLPSRGGLTKVKLTVDSLGLENLTFDIPADLPLLVDLLRDIHLSRLELHHFVGLPAPVLEMIARLNVPYDIYLHDYSWLCPRITLMDGSGRYCGEPELAGCEQCVRDHGSALEEFATVEALRKRSAHLLGEARNVFVPTVDTLERFARYFPGQEFTVTPLEPILAQPMSRPSTQRHSKVAARIRVAIIGAIGMPKGYQLLLDCAREAATRDLDLEFIVIGYTADDQSLLATGRVFITGPYEEEEVGILLDREACDIAFFPSVIPETWCYALTHAMNHGLPIVALDLGAQAERLRDYASAELLAPASNPQEVNASLMQSATRFYSSPTHEKSAMDPIRLAEQPPSREPGSRTLTSSVEIVRLPQGIYSFVISDSSTYPNSSQELALPALQIGVAPVTSSAKVEFLAGGSALDRWLAYKTDMIVVRIMGGDASLLLTSVHTRESPPLAVTVKRLNAQTSAPANQARQVEDRISESSSALQVRLLAHLRYAGDLDFESGRAGWPGQNIWIEGFAISSIANLPQDGFEYRGLVANGFLTPWLRSQTLCGSRGGGMPLLGYAVRLNSVLSERYECEYSGMFFSGAKVGPLLDGTLCSSGVPDDPLEAIEVSVRERPLPVVSTG